MKDAMNSRRQRVGIASIAAVVLVLLTVRFHYRGVRQPNLPASIVVAVEGEVRQPGTYILEGPSATIGQAIASAGGCRDKRAREISNNSLWSCEVYNGELLVVRCPESDAPAVETKLMRAVALIVLGIKLDLNRATEEDLALIPKMRGDFSRSIVNRRADKMWQSLDELREIPGVGPKTVEKWKEYLEVRK